MKKTKKCNCKECKNNPGDAGELYRFKTERMRRAIYVCWNEYTKLEDWRTIQSRLQQAITGQVETIQKKLTNFT